MENLEIYPHLEYIFNFINRNERSIILSPIGSGKSTGIPGYIITRIPTMRVYIVVHSTRIAISIVRTQKLLNPHIITDYENDIYTADKRAKIVYASAEYIKNLLIRLVKNGTYSSLTFTNILFIDDTYTGSADNYIIIKLWELYSQQQNITIPKIVLLSNMVDITMYSNYQIYEVKNIIKNITILYDKDYDIFNKSRYIEISNKVMSSHHTLPEGHFIVYAPGKSQIHFIYDILTKLKGNDTTIELIKLYSGIEYSELDKIYKVYPKGTRKVLISTNVIDSTIIIPTIVAVFDSMLEKRLEDADNAILSTMIITKITANQRCNRTGRNIAGYCYRMCSEQTYNILVDFKENDIEKIPLYDTVLLLVSSGIDPRDILPVSTYNKISTSIKILKNMNVISYNNEITELGVFYNNMSINIRAAGFLWWWLKMDYEVYPGLVITTLLDNYTRTYFNYEDIYSIKDNAERNIAKNKHREQYYAKYIGYSDLETYLKIWNDMMMHFSTTKSLLEWANTNKLKEKDILILRKTYRKIIDRLNKIQTYTLNVETFDTENVINRSKQILRKIFKDKELYFGKIGNFYKIKDNKAIKWFLDKNETVNTLSLKYSPYILSIYDVQSKSYDIKSIKFAIDISEEEHSKTLVMDVTKKADINIKPRYKKDSTISYIDIPYSEFKNVSDIFKVKERDVEIIDQLYIEVGQNFYIS